MKITYYTTSARTALISLLAVFLPHALLGQVAPSPAPRLASPVLNSTVASRSSYPTGFMDIAFGENFDNACKFLSSHNFQFDKENGWKINLYNFPLAGQNADEGFLSFNPDTGFYEGEAKITVDTADVAANVFTSIFDTINKKYRSLPKTTKRESQKGGQIYWANEWAFRIVNNTYEIQLVRWKNDVHLTYTASSIAPKGPTPPNPPGNGL